MEATVTAIITLFFKYLWVPLLGAFGWMWKEKRREAKDNALRFDHVEDRLLIVEERYMTEEKVKQIVKEVSQDWKAEVAGMKNSLAALQSTLQELRLDLAVSKAVQETLENKRHGKPYREG